MVAHQTHVDRMQKMLEDSGCRVTRGHFVTEAKHHSEQELIELVRDKNGLMVSSWEKITRKVMEAGPNLVTVAKFGIGVEKIDVDAATDIGILVSNTPVIENYLGVAESAVTRILVMAKRLKQSEQSLRRGEWKSAMSSYVKGKTVGIIGLGRIGSRVAKLLQPWGVRLLATDPYIPKEKADLLNVELLDLQTLLSQSDYVTIHCVATPETERMIGEKELRSMKKTAHLINTARGVIMDEMAVYRAVKEGWIAGAALDVFEPEPLSLESPLLSPEVSDQIWLTPHVSAATPEARDSMTMAQVKNCINALKGHVPEYVVNPEVLPKWRQRYNSIAQ